MGTEHAVTDGEMTWFYGRRSDTLNIIEKFDLNPRQGYPPPL